MDPHPPADSNPPPSDEYKPSSRSKGKFRFKSSSTRSRHDSSHGHKRHHSRSHRHGERREDERSSKRRHRRRHSPDPLHENNGARALSPDAAFRESLFDAMCDDEGAMYWEGVYGQPIHNYDIPEVHKGPEGELERMSEEEYAAYVRQRMWERTREGIMEEQERLRAERAKAKTREEQTRNRNEERWAFEAAMEDSLRRGAERKRVKAWEGVWGKYVASWEEIAKVVGSGSGSGAAKEAPLRNLLFWPVESGKRRDVAPESVREFMRRAPPSADLLATLKAERVRWHPDKMQHRYGALGIEESVMRSVTEVFQIVDRMWNEERERKS